MRPLSFFRRRGHRSAPWGAGVESSNLLAFFHFLPLLSLGSSSLRMSRLYTGLASRCVQLTIVLLLLGTVVRGQPAAPLYLDPQAPIEARVNDLLARMTLQEKVGQMVQLNFTTINSEGGPSEGTEVDIVPEKLIPLIRNYHVGSFLNGHAVSPTQWSKYGRALQEIALRESRLRIPIIYGVDHVHGTNYIAGGTVFPHNLSLACSFDDKLATEMGRITALEAAPLGHRWVFAPVLDVGVNPYWARFYETFGEEPRVAANMGSAFISGLQNGHPDLPIAACAKHFLGYSDPRSGWDRTPAQIPDQRLFELFLPPFEAGVKAGVRTVMANSGEVNGTPVHASHFYLTDILRSRLNFGGVVVSDWEDIARLHTMHRVAVSEKEAALLAVEAGIDMAMTPYDTDFADHVVELVKEGRLSEARIDQSVARVLRLKLELGLFENPFSESKLIAAPGSPAHRRAALEAARRSLVLLENHGALPLDAEAKKILVVGPAAESRRALAGGWTLGWLGKDEPDYPTSILTVAGALRARFPAATVDVVESVSDRSFHTRADAADVIVAAVGEEPYAEFEGDIVDLTLPADQVALLEACAAKKAPLVMILLEGRPRVLGAAAGYADAIVFAGLPGFEGGQAIVELLAGDFNPSGKLAFTYPAHPGHLIPYHRKPSDSYHRPVQPQWPFGHGRSYGVREYRNLTVSSPTVTPDGTLTASVEVSANKGMAGEETVLWFVSDRYRRITPPEQRLISYQRTALRPGEWVRVPLTVRPSRDLSYPDAAGRSILEPGTFELSVGGLSASFELVSVPSGSMSPSHSGPSARNTIRP